MTARTAPHTRRSAPPPRLPSVLLALAAACADPAAPRPEPGAAAPSRRADVEEVANPTAPSRYAESVRARLERAAAGLLYTSESDYAFDYVAFAGPAAPPLSEAAFRAAAGIPADAEVEVRTLDEFFARHIERVDPEDAAAAALVPRFEELKRTLRTAARDVRVFRVGRVAVRCFVVGVDAHGNVVGLATTAIET